MLTALRRISPWLFAVLSLFMLTLLTSHNKDDLPEIVKKSK